MPTALPEALLPDQPFLYNIPEIVDPLMRALPREMAEMAHMIRQGRWAEGWWKSKRDEAYAKAYMAAVTQYGKPEKPAPEHVCKQVAECDQQYREAFERHEAAIAHRLYLQGLQEALITKRDMINGLAATERAGMRAG